MLMDLVVPVTFIRRPLPFLWFVVGSFLWFLWVNREVVSDVVNISRTFYGSHVVFNIHPFKILAMVSIPHVWHGIENDGVAIGTTWLPHKY